MFIAILNFVLFEIAWTLAILGGAKGWPLLGALPAAGVVALHLALNRPALLRELAIIAAVTLLGIAVETAFVGMGAIAYAGTAPAQVLPPVWIIALWFGFGTLPNASLAWLKGRWFLQAVMGAVFGPLSYKAGAALGAATIPEPQFSPLFAIGVAWALAMPAIFMLAETMERLTGASTASRQRN